MVTRYAHLEGAEDGLIFCRITLSIVGYVELFPAHAPSRMFAEGIF
jgi:hypothetical protein